MADRISHSTQQIYNIQLLQKIVKFVLLLERNSALTSGVMRVSIQGRILVL